MIGAWRRFLSSAVSADAPGWQGTEAYDRTDGVLFLVLLVLFFTRLGELVLPAYDDITHAAMGRGILQTGDWFTMHYNGQATWLKPPLYFWLEAAAFKLFGVKDYWARFPSALCGFGTLIVTYALARRRLGRRAAFWSAVALATSFFFLKYARRAMLDVPVAFSTTLGAWALTLGDEDPRGDLWLGPALALGYYFKASQGLYLVIIAPAYLILTGQWRRLFGPWFLGGLGLGIALIAAWVVPQWRVYGEGFVQSQCGLLPILHRGVYDGRRVPFYMPLKTLIQIDWPWIPVSAWGLWSLWAAGGRRDKNAILLSLWLGAILLELAVVNTFFQRYLVPLAPPLALAAGAALDAWIGDKRFRAAALSTTALLAAGALLITCLPIPLDSLHGMEHYEMLKMIDGVVPKEAQLLLYKGEAAPWEQGLSFYADRYLDGQVMTPEDVTEQRARRLGPLFLAAGRADAAELEATARTAGLLQIKARAGDYVLFEVVPAR